MGFRYRKSKSIGPFRFTFSNRGISSSVGGKGVRLTKRIDGKTQLTLGIPGSGLSYTQTLDGGKSSPAHAANDSNYSAPVPSGTRINAAAGSSALIGWITALLVISGLFHILFK